VHNVDTSYIGHVRPPTTIKVEAGQLRFFLKAIGEDDPVYHDVEAARAAGYRDIPIPPTYLFCLQMMSSTKSYALYQELGIEIGRLLHGEQGFVYHAPICVGDELTFRLQISDIQDKKGGAMTLLTQQIRVENDHGVHVADLDLKTIVRNLA
jgi:acyl dehydratase